MTKPQVDVAFIIKGAESVSEEDFEEVLNQAGVIVTKAKRIPSLCAHVLLLLDLLLDYVTGKYEGILFRTIGAIVFSLLYVLNPIDLVFDLLPFGLFDDALMVALLCTCASTDIERYRAWRKMNGRDPPDTA